MPDHKWDVVRARSEEDAIELIKDIYMADIWKQFRIIAEEMEEEE